MVQKLGLQHTKGANSRMLPKYSMPGILFLITCTFPL